MERKSKVTVLPGEIAKARATAGLTQFELAIHTGYSLAAVQKWEDGTRVPRASALKAIREATGVQVGRICCEVAA
jgi:DNA-binding transcriptional regulator YiaG